MNVSRRQVLAGFFLISAGQAQSPAKRIILMLGPPGSGKTTQCERLESALGLPIISMPDMLQGKGVGTAEERANTSGHLAAIDGSIDDVASSVLRKRIARKDCERGFILDGYPSTKKQAEYLETLLKEVGLPRPSVIHLSLTDYAADQRLAKRAHQEDSLANTELRIVMYRRQAELLMPLYPNAITVDASQSPDMVAAEIRRALKF